MLVDKIKKSASELVEFFNSESPYRQANKGWLSDDIYLNLRPEQRKESKKFDQIAEVSVYSSSIVGMVLTFLFVIGLSILVAFSPLYLIH